MQQRILFIVHTEYHMLVAISLIADLFSDPSIFEVKIVQTIGFSSNRFKFSKDLSMYPHIKYEELSYDESVFERNVHFIEYVDKLGSNPIHTFISFNKLSYIDFLTIKKLSKSGTKIVLAPDGAAAYVTISRFTPRWSFFVFIRTHRYLWVNGVRKIYLFWPTLVYGALEEIQEIWVQFPTAIDDRAHKRVLQIDVLESRESISLAKKFFGYHNEILQQDCILYLNQPFRDSRINDFEISLLQELSGKFLDRTIVVKLHPTTFPEQKKRIEEIPNIQLIQSTIPAEMIVAGLEGAIILSFWSTTMLVNNHSCRFYWLFPLLNSSGISTGKLKINQPSSHIRLVQSIKEIV